MPRWAAASVGVLALLVGGTLVFRPFTSLAALLTLVVISLILLAVGELSWAPSTSDPRIARIRSAGWLVAALVIALWPGLSIRGLAVLVGVLLVLDGFTDIAGAIRASRDERIAAFVHGLAGVILGLLALAWPDVTVLVVAVVFGIRVAWLGATTLWAAVRGQADGSSTGTRHRWPTRLVRSWHIMRAAGALVLVLVLLAVSAFLRSGNPTPDAFYTPPSRVPSEPGRLLRSEPLTRGVPDGAQAYRLLYTSTLDDGKPAVASGIVIAAEDLPPGPRPVIAWAHGTTGVAEGCAPSLLDDPFTAGATPALDQVIANGWVMVATDYAGLGTSGPHPYLIGQPAGRSVLDSVRAARQLDGFALQDQTVIWGHSQGGHAALWAVQLAGTYAADTDVIGVAALSPAADLPALAANVPSAPGGSIFGSYVIEAYSAVYDNVHFNDYVRAVARLQAREMAGRCLAEPEVFVSAISVLLFDMSIWSGDPTAGALGDRLTENIPTGHIAAPLLIGQGEADRLITPTAQAAYVQRRCDAGEQVEYKTYPSFGHVDIVDADSPMIPDLLAWTQKRLEGDPAASTCGPM